MAKFCGKCGKPLQDGETCSCSLGSEQEQVITSEVSENEVKKEATVETNEQPAQTMSEQPIQGEQQAGVSGYMYGQPMQGQPIQGQPMQGQPMQGQPIQGQPMQGQPIQGQPMQGQPIHNLCKDNLCKDNQCRDNQIVKRINLVNKLLRRQQLLENMLKIYGRFYWIYGKRQLTT